MKRKARKKKRARKNEHILSFFFQLLLHFDCCYHYYVILLRQRNRFAWFVSFFSRFSLCVSVQRSLFCARIAHRLHNNQIKIKMKNAGHNDSELQTALMYVRSLMGALCVCTTSTYIYLYSFVGWAWFGKSSRYRANAFLLPNALFLAINVCSKKYTLKYREKECACIWSMAAAKRIYKNNKIKYTGEMHIFNTV